MTRKTKHRAAKSRRRAQPSRASVVVTDGVTKAQRSSGLVRPGPFVVRPSFFRYLRAYVELLDEGEPVTLTALARKMGIARQNLWRLRRRHPGLEGWASEQLCASNAHLVGAVVRRMAMLGLRGSREHAELFLKAVGRLAPADAGAFGQPANGVTFNGPTIVHVAVPRPGDTPVHASATKLLPRSNE